MHLDPPCTYNKFHLIYYKAVMAEADITHELIEDEIFPSGTLRNQQDEVVSSANLNGKSVAILFCDGSSPRCLTVVPLLINYYKTINSGGLLQKIEIVYVSCDDNRQSYEENIKRMPWLHLEFDDHYAHSLKQRYNIKDTSMEYGTFDSMEIPSLVVVTSNGSEVQRFHLCHGREDSQKALHRWDWRNTPFRLCYHVTNLFVLYSCLKLLNILLRDSCSSRLFQYCYLRRSYTVDCIMWNSKYQ
ncbi:bifunctional Thioredoxin-like superfamily/Thioredoxin-like fold [Babesia duncani]|uniref:protein-disulfide reductase n=1 Tax=Babesia duncani TaxID=323732 RepID=A0AAD9UQ47_9APIC|nr:bifunctional Thioredoxin-like superfamily/Thioredoxin-like fold [Babesia duncani]